ncbi:type II toxin-antitoxin system antitoxin DNA ADP-ribosyl glycohydrolase DarG [Paenibacillus wulumuqiensis]|uniref:type II toxin-antitoxin system antitoxin DNA ADP-ribosyl glycohydrolase DarG n=1 Tax=Paenibacillus wulumuqiensis TaxID=1567107 RepID=UPI0006193586|nr:macro domain-containing protein [Paenibacillus wulumuqiensis]
MIEYKTGNLLEADTEALINAVNCVGVMGKGIALQFKQTFPDNFEQYQKACKLNEVIPGKMLMVPLQTASNPRYIINFPTKRHWRGKSKIEDVQSGMVDLIATIRTYGIQSVAIPPLGCGLGGLDWHDVQPLIETAAADLPEVHFAIYPPVERS